MTLAAFPAELAALCVVVVPDDDDADDGDIVVAPPAAPLALLLGRRLGDMAQWNSFAGGLTERTSISRPVVLAGLLRELL